MRLDIKVLTSVVSALVGMTLLSPRVLAQTAGADHVLLQNVIVCSDAGVAGTIFDTLVEGFKISGEGGVAFRGPLDVAGQPICGPGTISIIPPERLKIMDVVTNGVPVVRVLLFKGKMDLKPEPIWVIKLESLNPV